MGFSQRFLCLFGGGKPYYKTVLGTGPIAYWPLNETTGTTAVCLVNAAQNGTYARDVSLMGTADGIGDGRTAPRFTAASTDWVAIHTAALVAAFNGAVGSAMSWQRVTGAGAWTDGTNRRPFILGADANNRISNYKTSVNNRILWQHRSGGTNLDGDEVPVSEVAWFPLIQTWTTTGISKTVRRYRGETEVSSQTADGAWAGNLNALHTAIGYYPNAAGDYWDGWLAHIAVWDYVLSPAQISALARPT